MTGTQLSQVINFELWNNVPQIYWLTIKIGHVPYGHIAKNLNLDDQYSLVVYMFDDTKLSNRVVGHYDTVADAKQAFFALPIGNLLTVTSTVC